MDVEAAKEKALACLKEKGIDELLVAAYLETRYYPSFQVKSTNDSWNIGLKSISALQLEQRIYSQPRMISGVCAATNDYKFWIGASEVTFHSSENDDAHSTQDIFLSINDLPAVHAHFYVNHDPLFTQDFKLASVEAYHETDDLLFLLTGISNLIAAKKQRHALAKKQANAQRYEGKFTFKD